MKKMMLSIIIPCYNREAGIKRTLQSLVNQEKTNNFEVIIIDDGSTDSSYEVIFDFMSQTHLDYKIIKQLNGGVSVARNTGIQHAKGTHLYFLDAEDYVESTFSSDIEKNLELDTDVMVFGYKTIENNEITRIKKISEKQDYQMEEGIINIINNTFSTNMCSVIFKHSLIEDNSIMFTPKTYFGEDHEFILKAIFHANKTKVIPNVLFNYFITTNSVTNHMYTLKRLTSIKAAQRFSNYVSKNRGSNKLVELVKKRERKSFFENYQVFLISNKKSKKDSEFINNYYRKNIGKYDRTQKNNEKLKFLQEIRIAMMIRYPNVYKKIYRLEVNTRKKIKKLIYKKNFL